MNPLTVLRRFIGSINEHRRVEAELHRLTSTFLEPKYLGSHAPSRRLLQYAQRNSFSILFLAIYQAIGVSVERRRVYGLVNHCIRGLVTAADNLLDDEYKEMLPLKFPERARTFKSVMHLLLFDRALYEVIDEAARISPEGRAELHRRLFQAMVVIGEEEATEEGGVRDIFTPEAILADVHRHKGGNLLRLAFVAPRFIETTLRPKLQLAERGVYAIGMALQVVDDLTDFYRDIADGRHNYFVSWLHHRGSEVEVALVAAALADRGAHPEPIEQVFASAVKRVAEAAVGEALRGFRLLNEAGFEMSQGDALWLIRSLFALRGLGAMLPLLPERPTTLTLGPAAQFAS